MHHHPTAAVPAGLTRTETTPARLPVLRLALIALALATAAALLLAPARAEAITPVIVNNGSDQWLESLAIPGEDTGNVLRATLVVRHDPGLSVNSVWVDTNFNGVPDTQVAVTPEQPTVTGGFAYSRVTVNRNVSYPSFRCVSLDGPFRRTDAPVAVRARLTNGTETAQVSRTAWTVADGQCAGAEDYPFIYNQSQSAGSTNPGGIVTFSYRGDDPDTGDCRDFGGVNWRVRRLNDGAIVSGPTRVFQPGDNTTRSINVTFSSSWGRGRYVVEAEALGDWDPDDGLFDGDSCFGPNNVNNETVNPNPGKFFYLGAVDVNSAGNPSGTLSLSNPAPRTGQTTTATLSGLSDVAADNTGAVQYIEWDADGNNVFERVEQSDPIGTFSSAQLQQAISLAGVPRGTTRTVRARITDNGAMNGADNQRRSATFTQTFTVANTPPVVDDQSVTTNAATPIGINLAGTDGDNDSLTYAITDPPDNGTLSGSGASRTYTSNGTFAGQDSFTYQVSDGFGGTDTATVTVNVRPNTQIDAFEASPTNDSSPEFSFSSPQAPSGGITFECRYGSAAFQACNSGDGFPVPGDGTHTFEVRAVKGSLVDTSPAAQNVTVDTAAPDTGFQSTPNAYDSNNPAGFLFSSTEDPSTFECNLDGAGWTSCAAASFFGVSQGSHTLLVRATDAAGNTDATPASYTWFHDPFAPDTTINLPVPMGTTNDPNATFHFTGSDPADPNPPNNPGSGVKNFRCELTGPNAQTQDPCSSPKGYTGLSDGQHTFNAAARDFADNLDASPASYTWTVDTTPPDGTNITNGPNAFTSDTTPTFNWEYTGSDAVTFECRVDGAATWTSCVSGHTPTVTGEGSHTFEVRAIDTATNRETSPASRTWTLDTVNPDTGFDTTPPAFSNAATDGFDFNTTDANPDTYECRLNGGNWVACNENHTVSGNDGSYTLDVRAIDKAGNTDPTHASYSWVRDRTDPTTSITGGPNAGAFVSSTTATFTYTQQDTNADTRFECRLDAAPGDPWQPCENGSQQYSGLTQGSHTFEVRAVDKAGNKDATPESRTWTVDTVDPNTAIDTAPDAFDDSNTATFQFSATDVNPDKFECRLDGSGADPWTTCSTGQQYTGLSDGQHTFEVRHIDKAGNVDGSPATHTWTVDTTAPNTTIDSGPDTFDDSSTATFQFSTTDVNPDRFECRLDGSGADPWTTCSTGQQYTGLSDGQHTFEVRHIDKAGNVDGSPATQTWTVDTVDPSIAIGDKPTSLSNDTSPTFTFSSDEDPNVTYECELDGNSTSCTSPKDYTGLSDGQHTFRVQATDRATNTSGFASYTWTLDATPPTGTAFTSGPNGTVGVPTQDFSWANQENGLTFDCRLDGGAWDTNCGSSRQLTNLSEGQHTFQVRAKDPAGNLEVTPASRTFTVDLTGPDTSITDGPEGTVGSGDARFAFTSPENGVDYQCSVDGGQWEPCTAPKDYSGLGAGEHTFQVRARDAVGNVDETPASRTWTANPPQTPRQEQPEFRRPPCTFAELADGCASSRMGVKLWLSSTDNRADTTVSTAGSPELRSATLTLLRGGRISVPSARKAKGRRGKGGSTTIGSFTLARRDGTSLVRGNLVLPASGNGTVTLHRSGDLRITLRGQVVTLEGLPQNVARVAITLNGRTTGILTSDQPCRGLTWRAALTDRQGASQTLEATSPCPPARRRSGKKGT